MLQRSSANTASDEGEEHHGAAYRDHACMGKDVEGEENSTEGKRREERDDGGGQPQRHMAASTRELQGSWIAEMPAHRSLKLQDRALQGLKRGLNRA